MAKNRFVLGLFKFSAGLTIALAYPMAAMSQSFLRPESYYMVGDWRVERVLFSNGKMSHCQVTRDFSSTKSLRFTLSPKTNLFKYHFRGAPFPGSGKTFPVTFWADERNSDTIVETSIAQFVENKNWASITERQDEPGFSSDALLNSKKFTIEHLSLGGQLTQWTYSLAGSKNALEELTVCSLNKPPQFG